MELPEPYWRDERRNLAIYHGDCRDLLPCFADGEFGSVVTDPPYGVGIADWDIPPDSAILAECLRVAAGTVVMFLAQAIRSIRHFLCLEPEPQRILTWAPYNRTTAARSSGMFWKQQPIACWRLPKHQSVLTSDLLTHTHWTVGVAMNPAHGHQSLKPLCLMADLVRAFGGASVLDPYLGSGTTLAACAKLGLSGTGIELEERYCEMAAARLSEDLSYGEPNLFSQTP